jgi:hypothetical protein
LCVTAIRNGDFVKIPIIICIHKNKKKNFRILKNIRHEKKFEVFFDIYINTHTETEQYAVLQKFLLTCSLSELLAWNDFLESKSKLRELVARGLTEEDHVFFRTQFAKFDELENQLKIRQ